MESFLEALTTCTETSGGFRMAFLWGGNAGIGSVMITLYFLFVYKTGLYIEPRFVS